MDPGHTIADFQSELTRNIVNNDLETFAKNLSKIETNHKEIIEFIQFDLCRNNRVEFVKYLINNGYENYIDYEEMFLRALWFGAKDIIKLLINLGKEIPIEDPRIVAQALLSGSIEIVKFCLEYGWPITAECLIYCSMSGDKIDSIAILKLFIQYGVDINMEYSGKICITNKNNYLSTTNVLDIAIAKNDTELSEFLLGNDVIIKERHLKLAVINLDILKMLLDRADWPVKTIMEVVREALENSTIQVLEYLLEKYPLTSDVDKILKEYSGLAKTSPELNSKLELLKAYVGKD